ncbi:MAG TPA: carbon-nitrogen hydrolase [Desulfovibrio sp.]|uniref:carbon-nitrogen hydrolase n=1 Tax=Desulfovibrio sp. TaxID=885 RepID=UPI002B59D8FC|nr:carbon-nitrogen hydrolase [Desulfovibrio sp.]HMM39323.1 carbon-nitrogen hydrolase [Desulfovibrio sp.]
MSKEFTLALIQCAMQPEPEANREKARDLVLEAAKRGADLVCLPELFASPYFCKREDSEHFDLAETIPGPSLEIMSATAREAGVCLVVPIFERRGPGMYHNTAVILGPDGDTLGLYRKMHIPEDPGFHEKFYFTPGDLGFPVFDTPLGRVAVLICWDQWFPEAARMAALQGAELVLYPTAIGRLHGESEKEGLRQVDSWMTVQRGHAVANGLFVAAANRIGLEEPDGPGVAVHFFGNSFVADPRGEVLARASDEKEEILLAEVDTRRVDETRRIWPFLRDRRIDAYYPLLERYGK